MSVRHHPADDLLTDCAAGRADTGTALVVGTHLSFCPVCSAAVRRAEAIGGAMLEDSAPVAMASDSLTKTLARLDTTTSNETSSSNDNTPATLRAFMRRDLSAVAWRRLGPRLHHATLYRRGTVAVRLLRGEPGVNVGLHTHKGAEYTVVLRGGFTDVTGSYGAGDFQSASSDVTHAPTADADGPCIILAVTTDRLTFSGWFRNLLARVMGF